MLDPAASTRRLLTVSDAPRRARTGRRWSRLLPGRRSQVLVRDDDLGMPAAYRDGDGKPRRPSTAPMEFFRRFFRSSIPAHPAAIDFYRVYYPAKRCFQLARSAPPVEKIAAARSDAMASRARSRSRSPSSRQQTTPRGDLGLEASPAQRAGLERARTALRNGCYRRTDSGTRFSTHEDNRAASL